PECPPAHPVVAGAEGGAAVQRDRWNARVGHRLDHLRAVLDHPGLFAGAPDDVAGSVLQVEQGCRALAAGLDEMRRLVRAGGIDRSVVGEDADAVAVQFGVAAYGLRAVVGLEDRKST